MEKWGTCSVCGGAGSHKVTEKDPILLREIIIYHECKMCDGSGFSGAAIDEPSYVREHEEEMLDALRAMNKGKY